MTLSQISLQSIFKWCQSGRTKANGTPKSEYFEISESRGNLMEFQIQIIFTQMPNCSIIIFVQPLPKISSLVPHLLHQQQAMFSTIPRIDTLRSWNIQIPLITSMNASLWGVDTMTAPSNFTYWQRLNCTSPVPGGISTIKQSSYPHLVSNKSWESIFETMIPLMAAGLDDPTKPKDIHFIYSQITGQISFGFYYDCLKDQFYLLIRVGKEGPQISESNMPTLNPLFFKVAAIFIATVLFPTPPLQLLTAIIFLIPAKFFFLLVNFSYSALGARFISTIENPPYYRLFFNKLLSLRQSLVKFSISETFLVQGSMCCPAIMLAYKMLTDLSSLVWTVILDRIYCSFLELENPKHLLPCNQLFFSCDCLPMFVTAFRNVLIIGS